MEGVMTDQQQSFQSGPLVLIPHLHLMQDVPRSPSAFSRKAQQQKSFITSSHLLLHQKPNPSPHYSPVQLNCLSQSLRDKFLGF
jgi:hypothetical protein